MSTSGQSLVLGIDLGGTKILTAVIDAGGGVVSRDHSVTPAEKGQESVIAAIVQSARVALEQAGISMDDLEAVGIGDERGEERKER